MNGSGESDLRPLLIRLLANTTERRGRGYLLFFACPEKDNLFDTSVFLFLLWTLIKTQYPINYLIASYMPFANKQTHIYCYSKSERKPFIITIHDHHHFIIITVLLLLLLLISIFCCLKLNQSTQLPTNHVLYDSCSVPRNNTILLLLLLQYTIFFSTFTVNVLTFC